jgi:dCMP deaminase
LERYANRDFKLAAVVHSEANAILNAAKNGATTEGSTAYVTFPPCSQCAAALIQAGVSKVVCPNPENAPERWRASFKLANDLLYEAGLTVIYYQEELLWTPKNAKYAAELG